MWREKKWLFDVIPTHNMAHRHEKVNAEEKIQAPQYQNEVTLSSYNRFVRQNTIVDWIWLIPKIQSPQVVEDYRHIALCNVQYKIISKLLTRRLQPLLSSIISENQSAFVSGRAISDNVLITHEVLHYLKTSDAENRYSMAIKTDMSKAYDRLEWDFIERVLSKTGFRQQMD